MHIIISFIFARKLSLLQTLLVLFCVKYYYVIGRRKTGNRQIIMLISYYKISI